jgi:hypothetical protein
MDFGMTAKDKWHLEQTEVLLTPFAIMTGEEVVPLARQIFDEVKAESAQKYGDNIYAETLGNQLVTKEPFLGKRLAAGLTMEDVRNYWNTTPLMQRIRNRVMELTDLIAINITEQQGKDVVEMVRNTRKNSPRYGEPEAWNPSLPVNQGFTKNDADIYIEFLVRVGRWQDKTSKSEQETMLSKHTSFNAMVRDLVRQGKL